MNKDLSFEDFKKDYYGYSIDNKQLYCNKISNYIDFEDKELIDKEKNGKLLRINFSNVTFHNNMVFEFTGKHISFSNCTYLGQIRFIGSFNLISFYTSLDNINVNEKGTEVSLELIHSNVDDISIKKNIEVNKLSIRFLQLEKIRIACVVNHLTISGVYESQVKSIRIDTPNSPSITLERFSINKISFGDTSGINQLKIKNVSLLDEVNFNLRIVNVKEIQIIGLVAENVKFEFLKVGVIELFEINVKSTNLKILHYIEPDDIGIRPERPMKITTLKICGNILFDFNNMEIINFILEGDFFQENKIQNSVIENLSFNDFSISKNLEFKKIKINNQPKLIIKESLLENVVLKPSFLHLFSKIEYSKSSMEGIKLVDFKEVKTDRISNRNILKRKIDKIDLLRFFKNYASQQGNKYLYHKYKAAEYNSLAWNFGNKLNLLNRCILFFNTISNNHSTNPAFAFCGIMALLMGFLGYLACNTNTRFVWELFLHYPEYFLTPIRFFSSLEEVEYLNKIKFLNMMDFVYKILLSYLIYQFVASFRKFSN